MGIGVKSPRGVGNADAVQQGNRLLASRPGSGTPVQAQWLSHLMADGVDRVQRRHGFLKDHADAVATKMLERGVIEANEFLLVKADAARNFGPLGQQAHERQGGNGFATAGLANQAQGLTALQREAHPGHGVGRATLGVQTDI